jgi:hypothetical protein
MFRGPFRSHEFDLFLRAVTQTAPTELRALLVVAWLSGECFLGNLTNGRQSSNRVCTEKCFFSARLTVINLYAFLERRQPRRPAKNSYQDGD